MNSGKLQDTRLIYRNLLLFCTLIMNYEKEKVKKKILFKITSKGIKYLEISLRRWKTYTLKTTKLWSRKLKMIQRNGKISWALGLEELIFLKYFKKQSTDLMQSLSKYQWYFHRTRTNNSKICMESQKIPNC